MPLESLSPSVNRTLSTAQVSLSTPSPPTRQQIINKVLGYCLCKIPPIYSPAQSLDPFEHSPGYNEMHLSPEI